MKHSTRTALAMATVLIAGVALSGCSVEPTEELTVFASWAGDEEVAFKAVLKDFEERSGIPTRYQGHRDVSQVLQVAIERGRPPDVAVLPRVNDLQRYVNADQLVPLEGAVTTDPGAAPQLIKLAPKSGPAGAPDGHALTYAVSIATSLKSVIWYDTKQLEKAGQGPPTTWNELVGLSQRKIDDEQVRWCLGMSSQSVSGWPGTDWIEDILLHQSGPTFYEPWTRGDLAWNSPQVKAAWETWGSLLRVSAEGTARASLYTTFETAAKGLLPRPEASGSSASPPAEPAASDSRRCHLDHQGSFAISKYRPKPSAQPSPTASGSPALSLAFFPTPPIGPTGTSAFSEVSDDVAVMFRDPKDPERAKDSKGTERARKLMSYLASTQAQTEWREHTDGLAFSRRGEAPADQDGVLAAVAQRLRTGTLCWDGSDLMPAAMATAFERAVLVYLEAPERLDSLLLELEKIRTTVPRAEWLNLMCVPPA
ncbi:ABC transporter substrate-binding protein [Micromonospora sp. NPDC049175]|uniref:ABC transporter substrate-binding protein n=1 Tax=Micromonospora sp. NPDC049175 TaxID=3364266 RepID=UPI0037133CAC